MPNYHTTSEGNIPFTAQEEAEWEARQTAFTAEQTELAKTQYQRDRAAEYPSINNYIDGVVKGDQAQIQAYIDACLAVKAKYPKPE
jgi:hypothetical protein